MLNYQRVSTLGDTCFFDFGKKNHWNEANEGCFHQEVDCSMFYLKCFWCLRITRKKICHLISQHVGSKELEIKLRNQQFECGETMEIEKKDKDVKKHGELYWPGPKKTTRQTKAAHHGHISTPKQTMNTLWHAVFDPQFCDLKIKTKKGWPVIT
jgi:hypothetical protein